MSEPLYNVWDVRSIVEKERENRQKLLDQAEMLRDRSYIEMLRREVEFCDRLLSGIDKGAGYA